MTVKLSDTHQALLDKLVLMEKTRKLDRVGFKDLPIEIYHHPLCPGVSSTRIKAIVERNYRYAQGIKFEPTPAMKFGSAFHALLEGPEFLDRYSIGKMMPGREMLSFDDMGRLKMMQANVFKHREALEFLGPNSKREYTFFSRDPVTGILRKCRPDSLIDSAIGDWKTTQNASRAAFSKSARRLLYRISARYYSDIVQDVTEQGTREFKFIACETEGQFDVACYVASEQSLETAKAEIDTALTAIANAEAGGWSGYPLDQPPISI